MLTVLRMDRVVVQVSGEIVKPLADRPYEGFLQISCEISPMASSAYEAGRYVYASTRAVSCPDLIAES